MIQMSATEFSRNLSQMLDRVHYGSEEIVVLRNRCAIARVVPGAPFMTASEAFADIPGTLAEEEAVRPQIDTAALPVETEAGVWA